MYIKEKMTRNQALGLIDRLRILLFVKVDIFVNIFSFLKDLNDYEEFKSIDVQMCIAIYSIPSLPTRILPSFIFTRRSLIFIKYLIRSDGLRGKMKDSAILLLLCSGLYPLLRIYGPLREILIHSVER